MPFWFTEIQSYANEPRSKQMIELAIQIFSIVIEVFFPAPRTFEKDSIDRHAQWLTDPVNGFAVPPTKCDCGKAMCSSHTT